MALWILLPVVSSAIYIGAVAFLLPNFFLQNKYDIITPKDRGIAKYRVEGEGRAVTYQTAPPTNKYIGQYVLLYNGEEKLLKCKLSARIDYIEYDVALFNKDDEIFNVLSVQEIVEGSAYTHNVKLPDDTSYIAIVVTKVDEEKVEKPVKLHVTLSNLLSYAGITLLLSIFTAFAVRVGLVNFLGDVFREDFTHNFDGNVFTLSLSIALAVVGILMTTAIIAIRKQSLTLKARNK